MVEDTRHAHEPLRMAHLPETPLVQPPALVDRGRALLVAERRQVTVFPLTPDSSISLVRKPLRREITWAAVGRDPPVLWAQTPHQFLRWDAQSGTPLPPLTHGTGRAALHPGGRVLVVSRDVPEDALEMLDAGSGRSLGSLRFRPGRIEHLAFSPQGDTLALATRFGSIHLLRLDPEVWDRRATSSADLSP